MNNSGLTPDEVLRSHDPESIRRSATFETHGVGTPAAKAYLETPEGTKFWQTLADSDPRASSLEIDRRAISQLASGRELPRMEVSSEPLVKVVPAGTTPTPFSPFFARESDFIDALASGKRIHEHFGLPIASEAPVYDVFRIAPKGPSEVFVSAVAPTSELGGQVTRAGGATQYLVPNRSLFTDAVRVGSIGNDLALHTEHVVTKGLGRAIAPISESTGASGLSPRNAGAARALGAVGIAATVYDTADMLHDINRSRSEGNGAATEDRVTRFATQNLGGWGGAVTFAGAAAAAGVGTGPGLLVTGAIGGVLGAVAGDKIADVIREHRINNQQDGKGNTWTFDPDAPARGWTRRELDLDAMRFSDAATVYKPGQLKADAELSDLLTFKASSRSIELALGAPPQNRDPYRLPASAEEQAQRQPFETGRAWVRDAQTQQWQQEIRSNPDGRGSITRMEPATPERAAQLERQSQAVIADNASHTPAAMAAQFETAYANNGWSRHGTLPAAVIDAKAHPGRVVGSDGKRYDRSADGQWTHDGLIWDSNAKGNLSQELETTFQHQQRGQRITTLDTVQVRPDPQPDVSTGAPGRSAAASPTTAPPDPLAALSASDRALFDRIRRDVPAAIGDEHVMHTTLLARQGQIGGAAQVDRVATVGERIFVQGTPDTGIARVTHDAGQAVPAMALTAQQTQDVNQQQEQSRQFAAAQPQAQAGMGR